MTATLVEELSFLSAVEGFEFISKTMQESQERLNMWRKGLESALECERPSSTGLKKRSGLAKHVGAVQDAVEASVRTWSIEWEERAPARELANGFGDRAIILVFGKVNAGKSSFCNFLVDRFVANGKAARYFYLKDGEIQRTSECFVEGVTETTSRIQGVFLDEKLVLLDTPGLHSVTEENGALTKRFTDSADAVLWLTSSASPGQVQELEELKEELKSGKPLLPVITKSDSWDHDEVDGVIVKRLLNKSVQNRRLQEDDVNQRTILKLKQERLSESRLHKPISVSSYMARETDGKPQALGDAGFERLYAQLTGITHKALAYKQEKASRMFLSHLDRDVLGALNDQVLPRLIELKRASCEAQTELEKQKPLIASSVSREVLAALPGLLEKHQEQRDVSAVVSALSLLIHESLGKELNKSLGGYVVKLDKTLSRLHANADFEDQVIEVEVRSGAAARAATGAVGVAGAGWAGAEAGAALGTLVLPGVGTTIGAVAGGVVGSIFGGWLGSKGGEVFEKAEIERRVVGVSYDKLLSSLETDVRKKIPDLVSHAVEKCKTAIQVIEQDAARLESIIANHERELVELKKDFS